jgi:uncharacterized membrane-anchored protein
MRLDYQIERDANDDGLWDSPRGQIVVQVDENRIAHYAGAYYGGALAESDIILNYRAANFSGVRIGVDSFFFQEGLADEYAQAQYADVRVTDNGTIMLIDLVGENFEPLGKSNGG